MGGASPSPTVVLSVLAIKLREIIIDHPHPVGERLGAPENNQFLLYCIWSSNGRSKPLPYGDFVCFGNQISFTTVLYPKTKKSTLTDGFLFPYRISFCFATKESAA